MITEAQPLANNEESAVAPVADRRFPWKLQPQMQINRKVMAMSFRRNPVLEFTPLAEAFPQAAEYLKNFQESESVQKVLNIRKEIARLDQEIGEARAVLDDTTTEYQAAVETGDTKLVREMSQNVDAANWEVNSREAERSQLEAMLVKAYAAAEMAYKRAEEAMNAETFNKSFNVVREVQDRIEAVMSELLDELCRAHDKRERATRLSFPLLQHLIGNKPSGRIAATPDGTARVAPEPVSAFLGAPQPINLGP